MRAKCGGFLVMENMVGLALLLTLVAGLAASVYQYGRAMGGLADRRVATRRAELVLAKMQAGQTADLEDPDMRIALRGAPVPAAPPPTGFVWAEVKVKYEQQEAALIGLVPREPFERTAAESEGTP